jgi:hypothetical protein
VVNLKRTLVRVSHRLVREYGGASAGDLSRQAAEFAAACSTYPVRLFAAYLDACPEAQAALAEEGIDWPAALPSGRAPDGAPSQAKPDQTTDSISPALAARLRGQHVEVSDLSRVPGGFTMRRPAFATAQPTEPQPAPDLFHVITESGSRAVRVTGTVNGMLRCEFEGDPPRMELVRPDQVIAAERPAAEALLARAAQDAGAVTAPPNGQGPG